MTPLIEETRAVSRRSFPRSLSSAKAGERESISFWSDVDLRFRGGDDDDLHLLEHSRECTQMVEVDDIDVLAYEILRQARIVSENEVFPACGLKDGSVG